MPEFHGNTLREALGKALGKRDQFGRTVKKNSITKPAVLGSKRNPKTPTGQKTQLRAQESKQYQMRKAG